MPTATELTTEEQMQLFRTVETSLGIPEETGNHYRADYDVKVNVVDARWIAAEEHGDGNIEAALSMTIEAPSGKRYVVDLAVPITAVLNEDTSELTLVALGAEDQS